VPSLDALHAIGEVVGVVCQPDKPAGRGLALTAPAVKTRAQQVGVPVVQPAKLRTGEFGAWVRTQQVDVAVVVAYGRILPRDVLEGPRLGCINVHASLLPKYRGAAPISWAIARGELESGITLMKLDEGMDTGPTFARVATPIGSDETAGELAARLARMGADAIREWLPKYVAGECALEPQDEARATMAPMLEKEQGRIDWKWPAKRIHDHVRGMNPWPGAFTTISRASSHRHQTVKVHSTRVLDGQRTGGIPGQVVLADKSRVLVACGTGTVQLVNVQPEGTRAMRATDWVMGRGVAEADLLGS
jgi:methionyl-tRNA formyltransferase